MHDAELVGSVLCDTADPLQASVQLLEWLLEAGPTPAIARALRIEPRLVDALRRRLPRDRVSISLACAQGAAWALGRRSITKGESWELVASLPADITLPEGIRRTTGETLILLIGEAQQSVQVAAPYVDRTGIGYMEEAIAAATARMVLVEVFEPVGWAPGSAAISSLRRRVQRDGDPKNFRITRAATGGPWAHLKVVIVDDTVAYIGSANITGAGLAGRNLELGVLVRGPNVVAIDRILDLCRVA